MGKNCGVHPSTRWLGGGKGMPPSAETESHLAATPGFPIANPPPCLCHPTERSFAIVTPSANQPIADFGQPGWLFQTADGSFEPIGRTSDLAKQLGKPDVGFCCPNIGF